MNNYIFVDLGKLEAWQEC